MAPYLHRLVEIRQAQKHRASIASRADDRRIPLRSA